MIMLFILFLLWTNFVFCFFLKMFSIIIAKSHRNRYSLIWSIPNFEDFPFEVFLTCPLWRVRFLLRISLVDDSLLIFNHWTLITGLSQRSPKNPKRCFWSAGSNGNGICLQWDRKANENEENLTAWKEKSGSRTI